MHEQIHKHGFQLWKKERLSCTFGKVDSTWTVLTKKKKLKSCSSWADQCIDHEKTKDFGFQGDKIWNEMKKKSLKNRESTESFVGA